MNFHHAYQGILSRHSEYNWPLNITMERPGHLKILPQWPSQSRLCSISQVSELSKHCTTLKGMVPYSNVSYERHTIFTDTCSGPGGYLYLQSALHFREPWIALLWKLVVSCGPPPIPPCVAAESCALTFTILSHLIALSCHLPATRSLSSMILVPVQFVTIPQEAEWMRRF